MAAYKAMCHAPGCTKVGDCARGFCAKHWKEFRAACVANGSWGRNCKPPDPAIPKFEYEGNEQVLVDRLKKEESKKQSVTEEKNNGRTNQE